MRRELHMERMSRHKSCASLFPGSTRFVAKDGCDASSCEARLEPLTAHIVLGASLGTVFLIFASNGECGTG